MWLVSMVVYVVRELKVCAHLGYLTLIVSRTSKVSATYLPFREAVV